MSVEARIKELSIELPEAPQYLGNYLGAKWAGNIAFSCGQGPFKTTTRAAVGEGITVEEAYIHPQLPHIKNALGVYADHLLSGLKKLTRRIHEEGGLASIQIGEETGLSKILFIHLITFSTCPHSISPRT